MLTVTLTVIALAVAGFVVWIAARRSNIVQRVSGNLSGPVEQMQEQILLTADTAVDRLDGKIAQMEILLAEIDRRSTILAQQTKQQQLAQAPLTSLNPMLSAGLHGIRRRALVFVISDFISTPGWEGLLSLLNQRHEVIAVRLWDPREVELPDFGPIFLEDAETGEPPSAAECCA